MAPSLDATSLTNRLSALAALKAREEMQTLHNYSPFQVAVTGLSFWWFSKLVETNLGLAAFLSFCAMVWAFWDDVVEAVAIVREVRAAARAARAPPTEEMRAPGPTDEEWPDLLEAAAYLEAMDDYSDEGRLFWSTRGGPPRAKPADLAAAALGGVAAYVALVVPLAL